MRAGPFSNEKVIRLLNRRFIPFHFDLSSHGYLGDQDASDWVKKHLPQFAGSGVSTPPVVFVTPDGKVVGQVDNYAPAETYLAGLQKALKENPEHNKLSEEESKLSGIEKSKLLFDLQQYDEAATALKDVKSDEASFWRGRIALFQGDSNAAQSHFSEVKLEELLDDVRMEKAMMLWADNKFVELAKLLTDFPTDSNRSSQARYFLGLAHFHQDKKDDAKKTWKDLIDHSKEDRWVYRADWAYSQANQKRRLFSFSSSDGGSSPLGRIGYMGSSHPDLKPRK